MRKQKLIDGQSPEEILDPEPRIFVRGGQSIKIYPIPDRVFAKITRELSEALNGIEVISKLLDGKSLVEQAQARAITRYMVDGAVTDQEALNQAILEADQEAEITGADILALTPIIGEVLLPNATTIISACLRLPEEEIANDWWLDEKIEALEKIIVALNIPNIIKKLKALLATVPVAPASIEPGPIPSLPGRMDTASQKSEMI